jgi:hypothetical protein
VLQALLIERVQDGLTGPIGSRAGALGHLLAVLDGLTAERSLIDPAVGRAREGNAVMLQLQYGRHRLPAHVFDGILIAQPVGTLDGVVHVEAPIVAVTHVAERSGHAALRGHGVAACREDLRDASRPQSRRRHPQSGS